MQLTRRTLLLAAGGLAVTACRPRRSRTPQPVAGDVTAVDAALADEQRLLAAYDAAIASLDAVAATPLVRARARHAAHVAALSDALATLSASPTSTAPTAPPDEHLRVLLRHSSRSLQAAAITASDGGVAVLLASIAAEHAADASVEKDS